jgi:hypothetical protein
MPYHRSHIESAELERIWPRIILLSQGRRKMRVMIWRIVNEGKKLGRCFSYDEVHVIQIMKMVMLHFKASFKVMVALMHDWIVIFGIISPINTFE